MNLAGKMGIPLILFAWLNAFSESLASEILVYSLPEEKVNQELEETLRWKTPNRQWIPLNGQWQLKDPRSQVILGSVNVPCTFQNPGRILLEKTFQLEKNGLNHYQLHLGNVNGVLRVLLNEVVLYQDTSYYVPISLPVSPPYLKNGKNILHIELAEESPRFRNTPGFIAVNDPRIDYGFLNAVYLEIQPPFHLERSNTTGEISDSAAVINTTIRLSKPLPSSGDYQLLLSLKSSTATYVSRRVPLDQQGIQEVQLTDWDITDAGLQQLPEPQPLWLEIVLDSLGRQIDLLREPVAIRSIALASGRFFFNDKAVLIRGINYVYQNPEGTALFDRDIVRKDLEKIKSLGFNAVRVIFHPLPEPFYQICDELGLLCFQDLPFIFTGKNGGNSIKTFQRWRTQYRSIQEMAYRHSSLAGIGVAYYIDSQSLWQREELEIFLRNLDPLSPAPLYVSTPIPEPQLSALLDFQIVEIIERNPPESALEKIDTLLNDVPYLACAFSKAISYRENVTRITQDLLQLRELQIQVRQKEFQFSFLGHFIPTYNDFYLQLPSLQNGKDGRYYLNRVGLMELKRIPRESMINEQEDLEFTLDLNLEVVSEEKATQSYLYILVGILNGFIFLITYKRFKLFRQNLHYSIRRSHGFFVNLQERIIIPYRQSFFLLLVIALNGAIIYSAIFFFYRNNLMFDYMLSVVFYQPSIKEKVLYLIWNQPQFLAVGTLFIILIFYALGVFVKVFSFFGGPSVPFNQALAVSIWSASPFIMLLPLGIFIYAILLLMNSYWILVGGLLYFHVWFFLRWINGIRVLTDRLYSRVLMVFLVLSIIVLGSGAYFLQKYYAIWQHIQFVYHLYHFHI